jgi:hypothetical protein
VQSSEEEPECASEGDVASNAGNEGDEGDQGDTGSDANLEEKAVRDSTHIVIKSLKRERAPITDSQLMLQWSEAEMQRMQHEEQGLEQEYRRRRARLLRQRAMLQQLMREFTQKKVMPAVKLDLSKA